MPIAAAIIGGVVTAAAAGISSSSAAQRQREANTANVNLNKENRDWQEMMANTAHQREVADLRAAGLNPILSGTGGGGAPSPSFSAAQVAAEPAMDFGDPVGHAASAYQTARADKLLAKQSELLDAQVEKAKSETVSADAHAKMDLLELGRQGTRSAFETGTLDDNKAEGQPDSPLVAKLRGEYAQPGQQVKMTEQQVQNLRAQLRQTLQQVNIGQSAEAKAKIDEKINSSSPGELMIWLEHLTRSVLPFVK